MRTPSKLSLRAWLGLAVGVAVFAGTAAVAQAHVQVSPTVAAPADSVKFTFLVPGESDVATTKVTLKIPEGVLPFSFSDPPGWTRENVLADNGAIDQVVWTGEMAPDGFVEFAFLAATPDTPGQLSWKSLQEYSDGQIARWIGDPGSDEPAPTTDIDADAPRQDAGGESGEGGTPGGQTTTATGPTTTVAGADVDADASSDDGLARGLALIGLVLGAVALGVALFRRPRTKA
jgi:uncharacterized protein YcnI